MAKIGFPKGRPIKNVTPERERERMKLGPIEWTPDVLSTILEAIERGLTLKKACDLARITPTSLAKYRKENPEFQLEIDRVLALREHKHLGRIDVASQLGDWRASDWMMRYFDPERFATRRMELSGPGGGPIALSSSLDQLGVEELRQIAAEAKAKAEESDAEN